MGRDFEVEMKQFPDNVDLDTTAAAIEEWLDAFGIGDSDTVYQITVEHSKGFWVVVAIFDL